MTDALYTPTLSNTSLRDEMVHLPFKIQPTISYSLLSSEITHHVNVMEKVLRKCIPASFLSLPLTSFKKHLSDKLPTFVWSEPYSAPECIEVCSLTLSAREDATENQVIDILKSWIVPGKLTPLLSVQSLHFQWDLFPNETFLVLQAKFLIKNEKDLNTALLNLPSLSSHIISGYKNPNIFKTFYSDRPLLDSMKNAEVHKELIYLIDKFPSFFDSSLFGEMSRFFSLCPKAFFSPRAPRLITKIIICHSLMRTSLIRQLAFYPEKKHIKVRFLRTELSFFFGSKPALGLVIGVAPLDKNELFEEAHILEAAQSILPDLQCVEGSFYSYQATQDPLCSLYIEFEKKDGSRFSQHDLFLLKKELEYELKRRIETLVPSIFMIRNEEETMRNILILSQELKYISDIPQVMISLEKQTTAEIVFIVVLVRLAKAHLNSLQHSFKSLCSEVEFIPDRLQHVGFLRKNHPKEANVFHLKIPKTPDLLRTDYSVNFYLARQKVASLLSKAIGPFRDYNGGMILKQGELFYQFKESFLHVSHKDSELLENFFFSLNPIEMQATLPLNSLQTLFSLFMKAKETEFIKKEDYFLKIIEKKDQAFAIIRTQDTTFKEEVYKTLSDHELWTKALIHTSSHVQGSVYTGFILNHLDHRKLIHFIEAIHSAIKNWKQKLKNQQVLKLSFSHIPSSLDPRINVDAVSSTLTKMLFEGLTRIDEKGHPHLAMAHSVEVSKDAKEYLFTLKKCYWSDGSAVTAYDFEYSWKKILSLQFSSPFTYLFNPIKNARKAKEGLCSVDEVGIQSIDEKTLAIDLEYATSEFLELLALPLFSPIHHKLDKTHPDWGYRKGENFICNGPFILKNVLQSSRHELVKNPYYWDRDRVRLEQIQISQDTSHVAHSMFKNEEIDWLGMPLRPWEPFFDSHPEAKTFNSLPDIHWCMFNTEKFPFSNIKLRKAFLMAVDQELLAKKLSKTCFAATSPLPLSHTMNHNPDNARGNPQLAIELFKEALSELGITTKQFPLVTLTFTHTILRKQTADYLVDRWKTLFNIPCRSEWYEYWPFCQKMLKSDFQIATLHWKSWIDHPLYTLKPFKYSNEIVNCAHWHNEKYTKLLDLAERESNPSQRIKYLSLAERILMDEAPLIPLYHEREQIIKKSYLKNIIYSKTTGYFDLKNAFIER